VYYVVIKSFDSFSTNDHALTELQKFHFKIRKYKFISIKITNSYLSKKKFVEYFIKILQ